MFDRSVIYLAVTFSFYSGMGGDVAMLIFAVMFLSVMILRMIILPIGDQ